MVSVAIPFIFPLTFTLDPEDHTIPAIFDVEIEESVMLIVNVLPDFEHDIAVVVEVSPLNLAGNLNVGAIRIIPSTTCYISNSKSCAQNVSVTSNV